MTHDTTGGGGTLNVFPVIVEGGWGVGGREATDHHLPRTGAVFGNIILAYAAAAPAGRMARRDVLCEIQGVLDALRRNARFEIREVSYSAEEDGTEYSQTFEISACGCTKERHENLVLTLLIGCRH